MKIHVKIIWLGLLLTVSSLIQSTYSLKETNKNSEFFLRSHLEEILNEKNLYAVETCSELLSKLFDSSLLNETIENGLVWFDLFIF